MDYNPTVRFGESITLTIGASDVRCKRSVQGTTGKRPGGIRSNITGLSHASRRRLVSAARNIAGLNTFVTFTYPAERYSVEGNDWFRDGRVVKKHHERLRKALIYRRFAGLWFLEFQTRGAPHFHFFTVGALSPSEVIKLRKLWAKIVGSDCPHHPYEGMDYQTLNKPQAAGAYAAKYATKQQQKDIPEGFRNVGRMWGLFGDLPQAAEHKFTFAEVVSLWRIARAAAKAQARANGYRMRPDSGRVGLTHWNVAPALLVWLRRVYELPESRGGVRLVGQYSRNLEMQSRECSGLSAFARPRGIF